MNGTPTTTTSHTEGGWDVVAANASDLSLTVCKPHGRADRGTDLPTGVGGTVIDALRPGQAWPVSTVHEGLSPASRWLRYSTPTPRLSPRTVSLLTDLRPGHHEAYAAWRGGRPIGIVRWVRTPDLPHTAELALEVVDAEQARGLGRALAAFAAGQACRAGVRTMVVSVAPDNVRVRGWLAKLHARVLLDDADRFALPVQGLSAAILTARLQPQRLAP